MIYDYTVPPSPDGLHPSLQSPVLQCPKCGRFCKVRRFRDGSTAYIHKAQERLVLDHCYEPAVIDQSEPEDRKTTLFRIEALCESALTEDDFDSRAVYLDEALKRIRTLILNEH